MSDRWRSRCHRDASLVLAKRPVDVGIIVAGVVGPDRAAAAASEADECRFEHERKLKASDDLVGRIDEVAAGLDELGRACRAMHSAFSILHLVGTDEVMAAVRAAQAADERARR